MSADRSIILVLNHNGRDLLAECLPSVLDASHHAPMPCEVAVVDNESTDDSLDLLRRHWPTVEIIREPNRGLASFNRVLARRSENVALLLNNDVKLDRWAVGPLVETLQADPDALFSAPRCWTFDGQTYEGMRTRVRMRFGLVQGCCRVPGFEAHIDRPGLTASAGPVLAVDRRKFLALGGFDELYLPGRIEDLDLGFRGWMAGWRGLYVPEAVAYHRGFGSFGPAFGREGCDHLALRNTLLFAWKNLSGRRLASHLGWLIPRTLLAVGSGRTGFLKALAGAISRIDQARAARRASRTGRPGWTERQEAFFREFAWDPSPKATASA